MWRNTFPAVISSFGNWDFRNQLKNVKMPVLIIHGDYDEIPMAAAKEWNNIFDDSKLLIITDVGHLPFFEKPEVTFLAIGEFLQGKWPQEAQ